MKNMPSFSIRYEFDSGSLPPPYHFEYTIETHSSGTGKICYLPDYPGAQTPKWIYEFDCEKNQVEKLYQILSSNQVLQGNWEKVESMTTGGEYESLSITIENREIMIPSQLSESNTKNIKEVYKFIRDLVPGDIWEILHAQNFEYEESHLE